MNLKTNTIASLEKKEAASLCREELQEESRPQKGGLRPWQWLQSARLVVVMLLFCFVFHFCIVCVFVNQKINVS